MTQNMFLRQAAKESADPGLKVCAARGSKIPAADGGRLMTVIKCNKRFTASGVEPRMHTAFVPAMG